MFRFLLFPNLFAFCFFYETIRNVMVTIVGGICRDFFVHLQRHHEKMA